MTTIGNNPPVQTNYVNPTVVKNDPNIQGTGMAPGEVEQGSLSGAAAAELKYAMARLEGIDWTVLTNDMALAANLSVNVTAIMVLLIEVMSQMRQDSRQAALEESQMALESGLLAAKKMESAAVSTFTAALISNITSMVTSAASAAAAGYQLKTISNAQAAAMKEAEIKFPFPEKAPGGTYDKIMVDRNIFVKDQINSLISKLSIQTAMTQGVTGATSSLGKIAAAVFEYTAAMDQAAAQAARATGEYQQAIAQAEQQFMQQLGDAIRALLSGMESVDQAQHKAMGAIYNC